MTRWSRWWPALPTATLAVDVRHEPAHLADEHPTVRGPGDLDRVLDQRLGGHELDREPVVERERLPRLGRGEDRRRRDDEVWREILLVLPGLVPRLGARDAGGEEEDGERSRGGAHTGSVAGDDSRLPSAASGSRPSRRTRSGADPRRRPRPRTGSDQV